jgi:hypothetical protein
MQFDLLRAVAHALDRMMTVIAPVTNEASI